MMRESNPLVGYQCHDSNPWNRPGHAPAGHSTPWTDDATQPPDPSRSDLPEPMVDWLDTDGLSDLPDDRWGRGRQGQAWTTGAAGPSTEAIAVRSFRSPVRMSSLRRRARTTR